MEAKKEATIALAGVIFSQVIAKQPHMQEVSTDGAWVRGQARLSITVAAMFIDVAEQWAGE